MWSRYFTGYLRRIRKVLLWFLLLTGCFCLVYFLYDLPLSAVLYAALLSAVCGLLFLVFDFMQYVSHCRKIEFILSQELPVPEDFPHPFDSLEDTYQQLIRKLYVNRIAAEEQAAVRYADMIDYYTLWIHQIKTPIAAMNLLLQTEESAHAGEMSMELFKIEQYTEMVLQYLRLGSTANDFVLQSYDLDDMIRQALRKYAKMFIGRKLSVDFSETHQKVLTDEKWVVFVIEQLLSNALKYTNSGKISIYAVRDGQGFVIEDTGIGISAEDLPRIFEKGYTGFNGRRDKKATGLGLYLCRQILDRLSHRIEVASTPGVGTKITVHISN